MVNCISSNIKLRILTQLGMICATTQSMVQEFCDKIGEQIVFFARLALRKHTQRMCPKRHIAARAQNTAYFDVKRPLYHVISALRKRLFTLARQKIFCDLRRNMIIWKIIIFHYKSYPQYERSKLLLHKGKSLIFSPRNAIINPIQLLNEGSFTL